MKSIRPKPRHCFGVAAEADSVLQQVLVEAEITKRVVGAAAVGLGAYEVAAEVASCKDLGTCRAKQQPLEPC